MSEHKPHVRRAGRRIRDWTFLSTLLIACTFASACGPSTAKAITDAGRGRDSTRDQGRVDRAPVPANDGSPATECSSDGGCPSGMFCWRASCAAASGVCRVKPDFQSCDVPLGEAGFPYACGCDHRTYDSDCYASAYGVNVDFEGECPPLPSGPCRSQADCGGDSYSPLVFCRPNACGAQSGVCAAIPQGACLSYTQVCGCDGTTYRDICSAERAHVAVSNADGGCP
jgi:hypothetical protein